ncbi:MAG: helix-turn-helix transcriptional regulator [Solirubrobacteraceae bacterium]
MLSVRELLRSGGLQIADVLCTHGRGRGQGSELSSGYALVLVRRGCFVRSADGHETILDPTLGYCMNPQEEQRYDHPHHGGDTCTSLVLSASLLVELWGDDSPLPSGSLAVTPALDLEHRRLLAQIRAGTDQHEAAERGIELGAQMLELADTRRVANGAPSTGHARRKLADGARELLAEHTHHSLPSLAHRLAVSPHHLSRAFREVTGQTISRHRMRLRSREVLERISQGERDLARLAVEAGFADQSHLCRVVVAETGETPSALRALLG